MAVKTKYRPRFATQLRDGLCADGKTISEVCMIWKISEQTYSAWIERWPNFADAAALADTHRAAYWQRLAREVANGTVAGNASVIKAAMPNIKGVNWSAKVEQQLAPQDKVTTLTINVLPSYEERKALMDERNIIDGEVVENESSGDKSDRGSE